MEEQINTYPYLKLSHIQNSRDLALVGFVFEAVFDHFWRRKFPLDYEDGK